MTFEPSRCTEFRYESATLDRVSGEASFVFTLQGHVVESFVERVIFTLPEDARGVDWPRVDALVALLGAILGLSYYKAAAPDRVVIAVDGVTDAGLTYFAAALKYGLSEFAYRAGLAAPLEPTITRQGTAAPAFDELLLPAGAPLVPIGGGKDSVVSVESLVAENLHPMQFAVNPNAIINRVAAVSGHPLVSARRVVDRHLLELNTAGALNGHVPVTAMNSLIALVQSRLLGLGPVVMSNESSASDPTLDWNGEPVNHQWSKSLEAERALVAAIRDQAGLEGAYFSLLRPFSEVRIARGFAQTTRYDAAIVSCNRAFMLDGGTVGWCGNCDKCRFVFLAFAPYMSRDRLVGIIGKDMFADPAQLPGYRALLGLDSHKPFECVGEEAECSVAMSMVSRQETWASTTIVRALLAEIPSLSVGDSGMEALVLGESEADALSDSYERARHALV
jgi:hypothetical protein